MNPSYRGFFTYLGQHDSALAAAGCSSEVEFAAVCADTMRKDFGANTVMVIGDSFAGADNFMDVVIAYVHAGMKVILYPQGQCGFIGNGVNEWDAADVVVALDSLENTILSALHNQMRDIVGICVAEEAVIFADNGIGNPDYTKLNILLPSYWGGVRTLTDLPLIYLSRPVETQMQLLADMDDDDRCTVYLGETYANRNENGVPDATRGAPVIDDMIEWCAEMLDSAESVLGDYCEIGHIPIVAGIPTSQLTGVGVEFYLAETEFYWRELDLAKKAKYKYQIGWGFVEHDDLKYLPSIDVNFKLTDLGSGLRNMMFKDTRGFDVF